MASMRCLAAALAIGLAAPPPAAAAEPSPPQRGAAGLAEVPLSILNAADVPISCGASIAHWYSLELGRAAPGVRLETSLWADPAAGTVFILNWHADRLPVERLWCGIEGRSWQTRATIDLARRAGEVPAPIGLACTATAERLACRSR